MTEKTKTIKFYTTMKLTIGQLKRRRGLRNFSYGGFGGNIFRACERGDLYALKEGFAYDSIGRSPTMDVNEIDPSTGNTPLFAAVKSGSMAVMEFLVLDMSADINAQNFEGETPLDYAIIEGQNEIALFLIEERADPNLLSNYGNNALHFAAAYGRLEVANALLGRNEKDRHGRIIKKKPLIRNLTQLNKDHESAYTIANVCGHENVARVIASAGGWTPIKHGGEAYGTMWKRERKPEPKEEPKEYFNQYIERKPSLVERFKKAGRAFWED